MEVDRAGPASLEHAAEPAGVVVVPMAEHDGVGQSQGNAQAGCVVLEDRPLSGVEQDPLAPALDPIGQAMLSQEPLALGRVLHENRNTHASAHPVIPFLGSDDA